MGSIEFYQCDWAIFRCKFEVRQWCSDGLNV
ncbi:hypothetical protein CLV77_2891 [Brevirhabdus pacifica]|nr:hypothetical protein CLV77_2891 [Brevirhabdus pacifica]